MFRAENNEIKYLEQWKRVKRWYSRVQKIKKECPKGYSDEDCLDEIYAFFMNCYHLKDWIEYSKPSLSEEVERLFNKEKGEECFKICADLVNGLKHVEASQTTRIDKDTKVARQDVTVFPPTPKSKYNWYIKSGTEQYEVFELSQNCIKRWENFLKKKLGLCN